MPGETGEIIYEPTLLASLPDGLIFAEINKGVYPQVLQSLADAALSGRNQQYGQTDQLASGF